MTKLLVTAPISLNFPNTEQGQESTVQTFTIQNTGTEDVTVSSITIPYNYKGKLSTDPTYMSQVNSFTALVGQTYTIQIIFAPFDSGLISGTCVISSNASPAPSNVLVSGTATIPAVPPPGLGQMIKAGTGGITTSQFHTDMDIVGARTVEWISGVYQSKTPPADPSVNYITQDFSSTDPPKKLDAMAYYICLAIATVMQAQWTPCIAYLNTPPPAGPLPPPFPYVPGVAPNVILGVMDAGQVPCLLIGPPPSTMPIPMLIADIIDAFIASKFILPI